MMDHRPLSNDLSGLSIILSYYYFYFTTFADYTQCQDAAVLHALTVSTFKRDAAANVQVVFFRRFLVGYGCAASVVGCVLLQDVTGSDHHTGCLDGE